MSPLVNATDKWSEFEEKGSVGDFFFTNGEWEDGRVFDEICILLPCGEGSSLCILPLVKAGESVPPPFRAAWIWNGDKEKPTLEPSILHHSDPPWHGFLRNGQLITA